MSRIDEALPVDLRENGLLWLINRTVFHPRGFALAMVYREGEPDGFVLYGDGTEPHSFVVDEEPELFAAAEATLAAARKAASA